MEFSACVYVPVKVKSNLCKPQLLFRYPDLFAVTYGGYKPTKLKKGLLCLFSVKNPSFPDYVFPLEKSAMCLDINKAEPNLIAVGFQVTRANMYLLYRARYYVFYTRI